MQLTFSVKKPSSALYHSLKHELKMAISSMCCTFGCIWYVHIYLCVCMCECACVCVWERVAACPSDKAYGAGTVLPGQSHIQIRADNIHWKSCCRLDTALHATHTSQSCVCFIDAFFCICLCVNIQSLKLHASVCLGAICFCCYTWVWACIFAEDYELLPLKKTFKELLCVCCWFAFTLVIQ